MKLTNPRPPTPLLTGTLHIERPVMQLSHPDLHLNDDWQTYTVMEEWRYTWVHDNRVYEITIPAGKVTDLASSPKLAHWFIGPLDLKPAVLPHDLIYEHIGYIGDYLTIDGEPCWDRWTRREADRLMARMMRDYNVSVEKRRIAYRMVRVFGWTVWNRYERKLIAASS